MTYRSSSDVRFHKLPTDPHRRSLWLKAIDRDPVEVGRKHGHVCSDHFRSEDYETNPEVRRSLGLDLKHLRLKDDVVPTQKLGYCAPPRKRRAVEVSECALGDVCASVSVVRYLCCRTISACRTLWTLLSTTRGLLAALWTVGRKRRIQRSQLPARPMVAATFKHSVGVLSSHEYAVLGMVTAARLIVCVRACVCMWVCPRACVWRQS